MPTTIITKPLATDQINSAQMVIDMRDDIYLLKPKRYPFLNFLNEMGKEQCNAPKFEFISDVLQPKQTLCTGNVVATATSIGVTTSTASIAKKWDIVRASASGVNAESTFIILDSTPTASTWTVNRLGSQTGGLDTAIDSGATLTIIGNAMAEGTGKPEGRITQTTNAYNYTQIFKHIVQITGTMQATKTYGQDQKAYQRNKIGQEHAVDIERAFLFNPTYSIDTTTAGEPRRTTAGLLSYISTNATTVALTTFKGTGATGGYIGYWLPLMEKLFEYGSDTKICFCGNDLITAISTWAETKLNIQSPVVQYGVKSFDLVTPYGTLKFVRHGLLTGTFSGLNLFVDPADVKYRFLGADDKGSRDHRLETNVEEPGYDGLVDMYLTECGLELHNELYHGKLVLS
jgi:hypothetical protein